MWTLTVVVLESRPDNTQTRVRLDGQRDDGRHVCTLFCKYGELGGMVMPLERVHGECQLVLPRG